MMNSRSTTFAAVGFTGVALITTYLNYRSRNHAAQSRRALSSVPDYLIHRPFKLVKALQRWTRFLWPPAVQRKALASSSAETPRVVLLKKMHRLLDLIEQYVLPLNCRGVCEHNPPHGAALVHAETLSLLVAATSGVTGNPLYVPELVAIESGIQEVISDTDPSSSGSIKEPLKDYLLVVSHPLSKLAYEVVSASGIRTVYVLFPDVVDGSSQLLTAAVAPDRPSTPAKRVTPSKSTPSPASPSSSPSRGASTPSSSSPATSPLRQAIPGVPSTLTVEGASSAGSSSLESASPVPAFPFTVSSFIDVVGSVPPGRRMFESQDEMQLSLCIDSLTASAHRRILLLGSIVEKLSAESGLSADGVRTN